MLDTGDKKNINVVWVGKVTKRKGDYHVLLILTGKTKWRKHENAVSLIGWRRGVSALPPRKLTGSARRTKRVEHEKFARKLVKVI